MEHVKDFLAKCEKCEHFDLKTCWAGSCQKDHAWPCGACATLKNGGWDQENQKFIPGTEVTVDPCPDYELMSPNGKNRRWLK